MNQVKVQLSNTLHEQVATVAEQEGVTTNHFIGMAVAEKIATLKTVDYLTERAKRGSREKLLAVLAKAPDVEPEGYDKTVQRLAFPPSIASSNRSWTLSLTVRVRLRRRRVPRSAMAVRSATELPDKSRHGSLCQKGRPAESMSCRILIDSLKGLPRQRGVDSNTLRRLVGDVHEKSHGVLVFGVGHGIFEATGAGKWFSIFP